MYLVSVRHLRYVKRRGYGSHTNPETHQESAKDDDPRRRSSRHHHGTHDEEHIRNENRYPPTKLVVVPSSHSRSNNGSSHCHAHNDLLEPSLIVYLAKVLFDVEKRP